MIDDLGVRSSRCLLTCRCGTTTGVCFETVQKLWLLRSCRSSTRLSTLPFSGSDKLQQFLLLTLIDKVVDVAVFRQRQAPAVLAVDAHRQGGRRCCIVQRQVPCSMVYGMVSFFFYVLPRLTVESNALLFPRYDSRPANESDCCGSHAKRALTNSGDSL